MEMNEIKQKVLEDVDPEIHRLKKKERRKYRALVTVEFVALIAGIMIVFYMLTGISIVQGNSMYPTIFPFTSSRLTAPNILESSDTSRLSPSTNT